MIYELRFQMRPDDAWRYAGRYPTKHRAQSVRRALLRNPRVWQAILVKRLK